MSGQPHITAPPLSQQSMTDLLCTIMVLVRAQNERGKPFWAYLCIKPSMALAFKEARDKGEMNLDEFGTIIEWGDGETVPADVQARMQRDYGANANYEQDLINAIEAIRRKAV